MTQEEIKYAASLFEPMLEADRLRRLEFDRLYEKHKGKFYHSSSESGSIYMPSKEMLESSTFKFDYCGALFSPREGCDEMRLADKLNDTTVGTDVTVYVVNGTSIHGLTHPYLPDCGRPFIRFVRLKGTDDIFGFAVDWQNGCRHFAPTSAITQIDIRLVDKRK